jgi:hypothetical protein
MPRVREGENVRNDGLGGAQIREPVERRPPPIDESRWGRANKWSCDQSGDHPIERDRPLEPVPAPPFVVHRGEPDRLGEQHPKHFTPGGKIPRQEPAPVGELRAQPALERPAIDHGHRLTDRQLRAEGVCAGFQARQPRE